MPIYVICSKDTNIKSKFKIRKRISSLKKLKRKFTSTAATLGEFVKREAVYPNNEALTKLYSIF